MVGTSVLFIECGCTTARKKASPASFRNLSGSQRRQAALLKISIQGCSEFALAGVDDGSP